MPGSWPSPRRARSRRGDERGQATVELALVVPFVGVLALLIVQVALVARDQVLVIHAAREAVRAAAVDASPAAPREAATSSSGLAADRLDVTVSGRDGAERRVSVVLRYRAPTEVPLVGGIVGDVTLRAAATMRVER